MFYCMPVFLKSDAGLEKLPSPAFCIKTKTFLLFHRGGAIVRHGWYS